MRAAGLLPLAAALALAACGRADSAAAAKAVREYDDALVRAFRLSDASRMGEVATRKEADRVLVLVDLKASNRIVLESTLEAFEVIDAKRVGEAAVVETKERWRYHDRPLAPGRSPGPEIVSDMRLRFDLVRDAGRWKVSEVTTVANSIEKR